MRHYITRTAFVSLAVLALASGAFARSAAPYEAPDFDPNLMPGMVLDPDDTLSDLKPVDAGDVSHEDDAPVMEVEQVDVPPPPPVAKSSKPEKASKAKKPEAAPAAPVARDITLIETLREARSHGDVSYVTGGIGEDERAAIEAAKGDYNLHVLSSGAQGAFVGEAQIVITRQAGAGQSEEMLAVRAGPLLYVRLPAGNYSLTATLGEQQHVKKLTVGKRSSPLRIPLSWK
jgi:hypothetical protein